MESFSYPKKKRLLKHWSFVNVNRLGKRFHSGHFVAIFKLNGLGITRLGVTASKKTGKAVERNKIKRLIREFFRLNTSFFPQSFDIVIVAKRGAALLNYYSVEDELMKLLSLPGCLPAYV